MVIGSCIKQQIDFFLSFTTKKKKFPNRISIFPYWDTKKLGGFFSFFFFSQTRCKIQVKMC